MDQIFGKISEPYPVMHPKLEHHTSTPAFTFSRDIICKGKNNYTEEASPKVVPLLKGEK